MNKYYNGKLFLLNDVESFNINVDSNKKILSTTNHSFYKWFKNLDFNLQNTLKEFFNNGSGNKEASMILKKFTEEIDYHIPYICDIVYEIMQDNCGNFYGREIITGYIFPIIKKDTNISLNKPYIKGFYYAMGEPDKVLTIYNDSHDYFIDGVFYQSPLIDGHGNIYNVSVENKKIVATCGDEAFEIVRGIARTQKINFELQSLPGNRLNQCCCIEHGHETTLGELGIYYNKYKKNITKKRFTKLIKKLYEKNIDFKNKKDSVIDESLINLYYSNENEENINSYLKNIIKEILVNLRNSKFPLTYLSIYDVDKIVEKYDNDSFDFRYNISFLYACCLCDLVKRNLNYDFTNSYIDKYLNMIVITINRLNRFGYTNIPVFLFDDINIYELIDKMKNSKSKIKKLV